MRHIVILIAAFFTVGIIAADSIAGGLVAGGRAYRAGTPEKSVTLTPDKPLRSKSSVIQPRGSTTQGILPKPNPGGKGLLGGPAVSRPAATGAVLRQVLPQAIDAGVQIIQRAQQRADAADDGDAPPAKLLNRRTRESGPILGRALQRATGGGDDYEAGYAEDYVSLEDDYTPRPRAPEQAAPTPAPAEDQGETLGDMLARQYYREYIRGTNTDPDAVFFTPPTPDNPPKMETSNLTSKPNESLVDRIVREDNNMILNYYDFHDRNLRRLKDQLTAIDDLQRRLGPDAKTPENREKLKNKYLDVSLEYYNREVAELRKLDAELIKSTDWASKRIHERRMELLKGVEVLDKFK